MKRIALVLCAALALGAGAVAAPGANASAAGAGGVVGTAQPADETALVFGDRTADARGPEAGGPSTLAYFIRMVIVLALVLGVIYAAYRLLKRAARPAAAEDGTVKVLASASLGPGKAIHVIGLGSKAYLVGATDASVSLIAEVEDRELLDSIALKAALAPETRRESGLRGFAETLQAALGGSRRRAQGGGGGGPAGDYLSRQRERLRKF